jgi:hypothetical protein
LSLNKDFIDWVAGYVRFKAIKPQLIDDKGNNCEFIVSVDPVTFNSTGVIS